jgi:multidrug resistance efflux pump
VYRPLGKRLFVFEGAAQPGTGAVIAAGKVLRQTGGLNLSTEAKTGLRSNELAVVAQRRSKAVLESLDQGLLADLQAKEAALTVAKINLGYTKIYAPADGVVGERQVRPGQLVSPGTQVVTFVSDTNG